MFRLSRRSLSRLEGVHPDLVKVVKRAIEVTEIDFGVSEGLRTKARQRKLVAAGASRTMNSRHLTGHAVDLVAYIGSRVSFEWPFYYKIAYAMQQAADGTPMEWGGVWDRKLEDLGDMESEVAQYAARYRARNPGKEPLIDGPHFQLPRKKYPA